MPQTDATYVEKPGMHRHRCPSCGLVWEHADEVARARDADRRHAHTCPECGTHEVWQYDGPAGPRCAHPKEAPEPAPTSGGDEPVLAGMFCDMLASDFAVGGGGPIPPETRAALKHAFFCGARAVYTGVVMVTGTGRPLLVVRVLDHILLELETYRGEIADKSNPEPEAK